MARCGAERGGFAARVSVEIAQGVAKWIWRIIPAILWLVVIAAANSTLAQTVTPLSNVPNAGAITTDGTFLYIGSGKDILKLPIGGGTPSTLYASATPCCVNGLTQFGGNLYWIDPNGDPDATAIFRGSIAGGAITKIYSGFATGQPIVDGVGITNDGVKLYTTDDVQGRVHSLNPDGSAIAQLGSRYGGFFDTEHFNTLTHDSGVLYVVDPGKPGVVTAQVLSIPKMGGSFSTLFSGAPFVSPTGIAVGNGKIYVADGGAGNTIWQMPLSGGTPTVLVSGAPFTSLNSLLFFNNALYVTDNAVGAVYRVSLGSVTDTTPDAFSFVDQTGVALSALVVSNAITVSGINAAAAINVAGGEYAINGGAFSVASATVTNGQTVQVRHTAAATNGAATNTTLTIGTVSDTFTSTTVGAGGGGLNLQSSTYFGGTNDQRARAASIAGGALYLSGEHVAGGDYEGLIAKFALPLASNASPAWNQIWPGLSGSDQFFGIAASGEGVYAAGSSYQRTSDSVGGKENKGITVKFPLAGPPGGGFAGSAWDRQTPAAPGASSYGGGEGLNAITSVIESSQTYVYAIGNAQAGSANGCRFYISKLDAAGNVLWTRNDQSEMSGNACSQGYAVVALNGNIYAVGHNDDDGNFRPTIRKYDGAGTLVWTRRPNDVVGFYRGAAIFNGALYAVGHTGAANATSDFLIEKWDELGNRIWSRTFDRNASEDVLTAATGVGSSLYAVGWTRGATAGGADAVVLEIDPANGNLLKTTLHGGASDDLAWGAATDGTDLYVVGESSSFGGGGADVMVLRYTVSAGGADTTPDAFSFTDQTGVALNALAVSNAIAVSGINAPASISVSGGAYSINGGAFTAASGTVTNGQTVQVRHTSAAAGATATNTTLTIGTVSDTFTSTTSGVATDTTPDPFAFTDQTGVAAGIVVTSNLLSITGINAAAPISVSGGLYSINGGAFTSAPGAVSTGQTVALRHTSAATPGTATNTTLTIGGVSDTFTSITLTTTVTRTLLSNAAGAAGAGPITADGYSLYFGHGNSVNMMPLAGGAVTTLFAGATPCCVVGLTRIGPTLYWIDPNGDPDATAIWRGPTGGGAVTKIYSGFASGQPIVDGVGIATDGVKLFTTDDVQGRVHSLNANGSTITQLGSRYGGFFDTEHFNTLTESGGILYIVDAGYSGSITVAPQVVSIPKTGGNFTTLYSGAPFVAPRSVAVGNGKIYVADPGAGNTIWELPLAGGLPTVLVSGAPFTGLNSIVFQGGALYATDVSGIYRVDIGASPGVPPPSAALSLLSNAPALSNPGPMVTDGTNLFVGNGASILSLPLGGGGVTTLFSNATPCCVSGLTRIGANLYWIDPNGDPDATAIWRGPTGGGTATKIYSGFATGQPIVDGAGITTDGVKIFTTDFVQGRVHSMNADGTVIAQLGSRYGGFFDQEHWNTLAENGGVLYVVDIGLPGVTAPQLVSIPKTGGPFTMIHSGAPFVAPTSVAVGNGAIFVVDPGANNTVWTIPLTGGTPTALAQGAPFVKLNGVLFYANVLYLSDTGNVGASDGPGAIYKLDLSGNLDTVPNPFSFIDQSAVAPGALIQSNTIAIGGINTATPISVTGGEYSIDGGPFTPTAGSIVNGQTVTVRHISSVLNATATDTVLTIGGLSDTFTSIVVAATPDSVPDAFSFAPVIGAARGIQIESGAITVSGINTSASIVVSGGQYSVNGGPYTSGSGTVANGSTVRVRLTATDTYGGSVLATLTIGGVSASFNVTTVAQDTMPDAFAFQSQTGVPLNALIVSNAVPVTGINAPATISIVGGEYSINGGAYRSDASEVAPDSIITVRVLSAASVSTATSATLTVGGTSATLSIATASAPIASALPLIAAGSQHVLALKPDGSVWGWGGNDAGQLGNGRPAQYSQSAQVSGLSGAVSVAAGGNSSAAILGSGTVWTWGDNSYGQLGNGTTITAATPVQAVGLSNVTVVSLSLRHAVAVKSDGTVWTWGSNTYGQLGTGNTTNSFVPVQVPGLSNVVHAAVAGARSFAVRADGSVWAWGVDTAGALGIGVASDICSGYPCAMTPVRVIGIADVIRVAGGSSFAAALRSDGSVWSVSSSPQPLSGLASGIVAIAAGDAHGLALKQDGAVWSWGGNQSGQLGNGTIQDNPIPAAVPGVATVSAIAAGLAFSIAMRTDGTLAAWGDNYTGQLGNYGGNFRAFLRERRLDNSGYLPPSISQAGSSSSGLSPDSGVASFADLDSVVKLGAQRLNSPPLTRAFRYFNLGQASIAISSIAIEGSAEFQVLSQSANNDCSHFSQLPSGENCLIIVAFNAASIGQKSARLVVGSSATDSPTSLNLGGSGVEPGVFLSTTQLSFGNQMPGTTSAPRTVSLANSGGATLNISSITIGGTHAADFARTSNCGSSLAPGASCQIDISFTPGVQGTRLAQLTIASDAAGLAPTVSLTGTGADSQAPTVPAGLTATAASAAQINLAWTASTDNVAVTAYQLYRGGVFRTTVNAPTLNFSDTGLTASTGYSYKVAACDAAGNCSAESAPATATTLAIGQFAHSPKLESGFNLGSNALNITLNVAALFGNQDAPVTGVTSNIVSIWKWNAVAGRWAFYSPQLTGAGNTSYAASHSYDALSTINPGEGFWMNAINPITLPGQSGTGFAWSSVNFAALPSGFNLIATSSTVTPSQFNTNVSATPPAAGVIPTDNFVSLWVWDAALGKWYFYSPLLEASGGLAAVKAYADSHNYLHFQDAGKTLGVGTGFWVNRP